MINFLRKGQRVSRSPDAPVACHAGGEEGPASIGEVVRVTLPQECSRFELPPRIVSDNGTELTSHAILGWQAERGAAWHDIAPGKLMQNGPVESLIGRLRDECLNVQPVQEPASSPAPARAPAGRLKAR